MLVPITVKLTREEMFSVSSDGVSLAVETVGQVEYASDLLVEFWAAVLERTPGNKFEDVVPGDQRLPQNPFRDN